MDTFPCALFISCAWVRDKSMSSNYPYSSESLLWRHNGQDGVSNHQHHHCLLNRLFRCRSKKTSNSRVTGLCAGISPVTKWPVTRKMFPFDDVIMFVTDIGGNFMIRVWIINCVNCFVWSVITHPCPDFKGGFTKAPLMLGHRWVITS